MEDELDSSEIGDWLAYSRVEPFGMQAVEKIAGYAGAMLGNCWVSGQGFEPYDFMAFTEAPQQTVEDMMSAIKDAKAGA